MFTMHTMPNVSENVSSRGAVSLPSALLRLEGLALFLSATAFYAYFGANGWLFVALLLVPDLSALGYAINPRVGSMTYNFAHTTSIPVILLVIAFISGTGEMVIPFILIWLAHIGMDRTVGYGLKYAAGFKQTHLGRV